MGFGMILGGALAGVGKGIAEVGAEDLKQRHEAAMQALKAQQLSANNVQVASLEDQKDARHVSRETDSKLITQSDEQKFLSGQAQVKISAERDKQESQQAFELRKTNLQIAGDMARTLADTRLKSELERGDVHNFYQDPKTGGWFAQFKDGSTRQVASASGNGQFTSSPPPEKSPFAMLLTAPPGSAPAGGYAGGMNGGGIARPNRPSLDTFN